MEEYLELLQQPLSVVFSARNTLSTEGRTGYPLPLMVGYLICGMYRFTRENPRKPGSGFTLVGLLSRFFLSFVSYAYPCTIACDFLVLGVTPKIFFNFEALSIWAALFFMTQILEYTRVLEIFVVQLVCRLIWTADMVRAMYLTIERADTLGSTGVGATDSSGYPTAGSEFSRIAQMVWCGLVWLCAPTLFRQHLFGLVAPSRASAANTWPTLFQICSMVGYCLYVVFVKCASSGGGGGWGSSSSSGGSGVSDCAASEPSAFGEMILVSVLVHFSWEMAMMGGLRMMLARMKKE